MLKVGLLHISNRNFSDTQNYGLKFSPVWAFVLSSYINKFGSDAKLFDLNLNDFEIIEECDFYLMSGINQDLESLLNLANYVKSKFGKKIFIGGPIAWSFSQANELHKLSFFDHICIGDGELIIPKILSNITLGHDLPKIVSIDERFDLTVSLPMKSSMMFESVNHYYGGVIEVSRGCPFLCEFCDIRVMPDNNKNRNKSYETILKDLDVYRKSGVRNIQFACDNFIGDLEWAKGLVDELINYNESHNYSPSFYTWLTINISYNEDLMRKMRKAGFDNLFIGVESFDNNTLIETAKLQNTKVEIIDSIRNIQSFGFVVVAGLIFGFDSDGEDCFENTLSGITESGLLSGDASILTALPGTPLYRRMKLSSRLRTFNHESFLGGHKYVTNIKYLMPKKKLISGYIKFSQSFLDGRYQFNRLKNFYNIIENSKNFEAINRPGYTNINEFLRQGIRHPDVIFFHLKRLLPLLTLGRLFYLIRGACLMINRKIRKNIGSQYFIFWLFIWVNALNKYKSLSEDDFDVESVDENYDLNSIIPIGYLEFSDEKIPLNKIKAQRKATVAQLRRVISLKSLNG